MAGLGTDHPIARREAVAERRHPGAGARGGIEDQRIAEGEQRLEAVQQAARQVLEIGAAMIDGRPVCSWLGDSFSPMFRRQFHAPTWRALKARAFRSPRLACRLMLT